MDEPIKEDQKQYLNADIDKTSSEYLKEKVESAIASLDPKNPQYSDIVQKIRDNPEVLNYIRPEELMESSVVKPKTDKDFSYTDTSDKEDKASGQFAFNLSENNKNFVEDNKEKIVEAGLFGAGVTGLKKSKLAKGGELSSKAVKETGLLRKLGKFSATGVGYKTALVGGGTMLTGLFSEKLAEMYASKAATKEDQEYIMNLYYKNYAPFFSQYQDVVTDIGAATMQAPSIISAGSGYLKQRKENLQKAAEDKIFRESPEGIKQAEEALKRRKIDKVIEKLVQNDLDNLPKGTTDAVKASEKAKYITKYTKAVESYADVPSVLDAEVARLYPKGLPPEIPKRIPSFSDKVEDVLKTPIFKTLKPLISNPVFRTVASASGGVGAAANAFIAYEDFKKGDKFGGTVRSAAAVSDLLSYVPDIGVVFSLASVGLSLIDDATEIAAKGSVSGKQKFGPAALKPALEGIPMIKAYSETIGLKNLLFPQKNEETIPEKTSDSTPVVSPAPEPTLESIPKESNEPPLYQLEKTIESSELKNQSSMNFQNDSIFNEFINSKLQKDDQMNFTITNLMNSMQESFSSALSVAMSQKEYPSINIEGGESSSSGDPINSRRMLFRKDHRLLAFT